MIEEDPSKYSEKLDIEYSLMLADEPSKLDIDEYSLTMLEDNPELTMLEDNPELRLEEKSVSDELYNTMLEDTAVLL
eukprot:3877039-Rhodomonas_salina.2